MKLVWPEVRFYDASGSFRRPAPTKTGLTLDGSDHLTATDESQPYRKRSITVVRKKHGGVGNE